VSLKESSAQSEKGDEYIRGPSDRDGESRRAHDVKFLSGESNV
jgi:hypothetical protein